ncbi:hypothetical protein PTSG_08005 [Salpingoeca rosetta]|uniref:Regulatory protein SIR2 homolog 7 n=1 Tax=Salpingoeca rosetta (strain ATCC 50818 / BSB-021) TaxID=946362 RepID=F2UHQ6_SALR5|nr:uncharacterized protein PTSG_08005 [Salpingoeca rosetta]EGD76655.1 hypothetical protein PTSG_08005 [Salpingoeca rosetta]|eukprot:XP_004991027.1 hypothetical protein PTSG_08005 [Salpingoeca rosetta]
MLVGPAGLWARAQRGEAPESIARDLPNLADCTPTYTHMVLARLVAVGAVDFIVSQNCDGLHLRSGVPASKLAEIHGNCFIEVCPACHKVYRRRFDVSAQSRVRRHTTRRTCTHCTQQHQHTEQQQPQPQQQPQQQHQQQPPSPRPLLTAAPCPRDGVHLEDTIVHFGETTRHASVANWGAAMAAAAAATVVVVLGSSLKVLKAYPCLWKRVKQRKCELFIVNSQWTPLDRWAVQKTHSDVDAFMRALVAAHDRAPAAGDGSGGGGASRGVSNDEHGGAPKSVVKKEEEEEEEDEDQRQQDYDQDHDQEEEELKSVAPAALVNGSWRPQTYVREEDPFWQQCDDDDGDNDDDDDARAPGGWLMAGLKRSAHRK